jgi:hypothetical protein
MPITANAVAISAQEVLTFNASPLTTSKTIESMTDLFPTVLTNRNPLPVVVLSRSNQRSATIVHCPGNT